MPKSFRTQKRNTDLPVRVNVDIQPGSTSPAQKAMYLRFWTKLVSQVKDEVNRGEPAA